MAAYSAIWSIGLFYTLLTLDVMLAALTYASVHSFKLPALTVDALYDFTHDALDFVFLAVLRAVTLGIVFLLTVRYCKPNYARAYEEKCDDELRRWRRARARRKDNPRARLPTTTQSINGNGQSINGLHQHDRAVPLLINGDEQSDDIAEMESGVAYDKPPVVPPLTETEKHAVNHRCHTLRTYIHITIFVVSTAMQMAVGIKVVSFNFTDNFSPVVMALAIVFINAHQHLSYTTLNRLTREQGYLFPKLHPHRIYFDISAYGHGCDLCRIRIHESYRCNQCDFDLCTVCFARKNRAKGEGIVRGDKGTKEDKEITSTQYVIRAIKLAIPHSFLIIIAIICLLTNAAASLLLPNLQGSILDDVIQKNQANFLYLIKEYIIVSVATGLFGAIRSLCFSVVGSRIANDVRNALFKSIILQDISFFDGVTTGELTSRLARDTDAMVSPMQTVLAIFLSNFLLLIGGMFMCFYTSWRLSILAITSIFPIIQITRAYASYSRKLNKQVWAALADSSNVATQAISNIRTVRSFGTEPMETSKYLEATQEALDKNIIDSYASALSYTLTTYLDLTTSVLILWYGGVVVMGYQIDNDLTVGKLITFQLYWNMMNNAYSSLNSMLNNFTRAAGAAQRVITLMDNTADIHTNITQNTLIKKNITHGKIEMKHISFFYQMRPEKLVLSDINLIIPAGTTCALVGRSGGGKSTLVHLLLRLYDRRGGEILYDDVDINEYDLSVLRRGIAVVAQDTQLFGNSFAENIMYGLEKKDQIYDDMIAASKAAHAHDFIMEMDDGYETRVGERGIRLSGGQRQRVAIARAIMRKAKVLLLDEATSALDTESEGLVQSAIDNLINQYKCTVILVAHRLSTVMNADQICVIDSGQIVENGTHEQLCSHGGIYWKLVKRQLERKSNTIEEAKMNEEAAEDNVSADKNHIKNTNKTKKDNNNDSDVIDKLLE